MGNFDKTTALRTKTSLEFRVCEHGLLGLYGLAFILMTIFFKIALFENKG